MFEELGLNAARQHDNGANPRPDNRSGWLEGETPGTPIDALIDRQDEAPLLGSRRPSCGTGRRTRSRPGPTGRRNRFPEVVQVHRGGGRMSDIEQALERPARPRPVPAHAHGLRARRARACCSTATRCCCSARTTTSASPTTRACARPPPTRRCARASARGVAARLGQHDASTAGSRSSSPTSRARSARCCSAPATSPTPA